MSTKTEHTSTSAYLASYFRIVERDQRSCLQLKKKSPRWPCTTCETMIRADWSRQAPVCGASTGRLAPSCMILVTTWHHPFSDAVTTVRQRYTRTHDLPAAGVSFVKMDCNRVKPPVQRGLGWRAWPVWLFRVLLTFNRVACRVCPITSPSSPCRRKPHASPMTKHPGYVAVSYSPPWELITPALHQVD